MTIDENVDRIVLPRDVLVIELGERLPWIELGDSTASDDEGER